MIEIKALSAKFADIGNFEIAQSLIKLRMESASIAKFAKKRVAEDGEFAKVYAESIAEWTDEIALVVEATLAKFVEVNKKTQPHQ